MPDAVNALLRPAALAYGAAMRFRNALYDRGVFACWKAPIPVVSVGNITAGGTGKTPLVDWIVQCYRAHGVSAAIISRGYGRRTKGAQLVSDGEKVLLGSRDAGDEIAMLAARNPSSIVIVAEERQEGVELLMRSFKEKLPDVIVLDDAFQHRKIARDLDIVVINAAEPFSDAAMLPEGRLREPLEGLGRADLFILNKITDERRAAGIAGELMRLGKPVVRARIRAGRLVAAGGIQGEECEKRVDVQPRALAFAGIGAPQGFLQSLREAGVEVVQSRLFRDHQPYTAASVRGIVEDARRQGIVPVTTEKDWFRIRDDREMSGMLTASGCRYLPIEPDLFEGESMLEGMLMAILRPKPVTP